MIQAILAWFFNGGVAALTAPLERAYTAKLTADTDEKKLEAEKQIAFFQGQISLAITAAQNDKWWSTREIIGKCAMLYVGKIVVWDTVFQLGSTPDPGPQVTGIVWTVIGFYFGSKAATDVAARILARR